MKFFELNNVSKLILTTNDIANLLSINKESANVLASRYAKKGYLIRIKRDSYITADRFKLLREEDFFRLANIIQTPSYISLTTALSYYNISTQQLRNYIESIALKRTKTVMIEDMEFNYTLIKKDQYTGFEMKEDFFIANSDKALADAIYLTALNRYNCDFDAIDFKKIDKKHVTNFLVKTNKKTKLFWNKLCRTYKI